MSAKEKKVKMDASQRDGVQYRKASILDMIIGNANNGTGMCFYLLMMYASYVGNAGYGMATAVVGLVLTGTRLLDGFTDPICAAIFDKVKLKKGKIRIFLIVGLLIEAVAVLAMFSWCSGKTDGVAGAALFIVLYIVYIIGYTINNIAGATVGIVITNDPTQRPMNGVISTLYSYIAPILFSTVVAFLILPKYDNQYNVPMLKEASYVYVAFAFIFTILACIGLRHADTEEVFGTLSSSKKEKLTIKDMIALVKDNRAMQMYIVSAVSDKIAQQTASQSVVTVMLSGILIGSYQAATLINNFSMICSIVFVFIGGAYVARQGAKKATSLFSLFAIIISVLMVIFCRSIDMRNVGVVAIPTIIYCGFQLLLSGAKMVITTAGNAMRGDVTDYELERSGNYMPGTVAGVYNFVDKMITSFASTIAAFCVALIGYKTTMPQQGDDPTSAIFWMTMFLAFGLPLFGWVCNIISMKFYPLTKERMIEVQKNVADAKQKAMEAEKAIEAENAGNTAD